MFHENRPVFVFVCLGFILIFFSPAAFSPYALLSPSLLHVRVCVCSCAGGVVRLWRCCVCVCVCSCFCVCVCFCVFVFVFVCFVALLFILCWFVCVCVRERNR